MPKTKLSENIKAAKSRYEPLVVLIRGTMAVKRIECDKLSAVTEISRETLYRRFKRPQEFRLKELSAISKYLSIPWEELREKIPV